MVDEMEEEFHVCWLSFPLEGEPLSLDRKMERVFVGDDLSENANGRLLFLRPL